MPRDSYQVSKLRKSLKPGDVVTTSKQKEVFYSGYNGAPISYFEPGMRGVVFKVHSPAVWSNRVSHDESVLIDFEVEPKEKDDVLRVWLGPIRLGGSLVTPQQGNVVYRVSLDYRDVVLLDKI